MDSTTQELKDRTKDQLQTDDDVSNINPQKPRQPAIPRRGIRSLAVGVAVPLALTLANISIFGWNLSYRTIQKPFWIPPLWALHLTCLSSAFVMGLSAWLVWAEGGFHEKPAAVGFYLGQLGLSLAWDPILFKMGAARLGLLVCLAQIATTSAMVRCKETMYHARREVRRIITVDLVVRLIRTSVVAVR